MLMLTIQDLRQKAGELIHYMNYNKEKYIIETRLFKDRIEIFAFEGEAKNENLLLNFFCNDNYACLRFMHNDEMIGLARENKKDKETFTSYNSNGKSIIEIVNILDEWIEYLYNETKNFR